jgi:hypothetical protein
MWTRLTNVAAVVLFAWLVAGFGFALCQASHAPHPPSQSRAADQNSGTANQAEKKSDANGSEAKSVWVPTDSIGLYTLVLSIFTAVLAVATIGLGILSYFQIRLARTEFIASHRPLLAIRFVEISLDESDKVGVEFGVINAGTSDAIVTGSSVVADFLPDTEWPNPHDYPVNNVISPRRFSVGATDRYTVKTDHFVSLVDVYAEGLQTLRLYGYIVYTDQLKRPRTTFFCRLYDRRGDRFVAPDNSDYDRTD